MKKVKLHDNGDVELTVIYEDKTTTTEILDEHNIMLVFDVHNVDITNATVRSIFKMLSKYPSLQYMQDFAVHYVDKVNYLPPITPKFKEIVVGLVVDGKHNDYRCDMSFEPYGDKGFSRAVFSDPYPHEFKTISSYYGAHGVVEGEEQINYSFSMNDIVDYIDSPLVVGDAFVVVNERIKFGDSPHETEIRFRADSYPTLLEITNAVLNEVTFHGTDAKKKEMVEQLESRMKNIDDED